MLPPGWLLTSVAITFVFFFDVHSVDRSSFRTCEEVAFCKRHRKPKSPAPPYIALRDTLNDNDSSVSLVLENTLHKRKLLLTLTSYGDNRIGVTLDEINPIRNRFKVTDSFVKTPVKRGFRNKWQDSSSIHLTTLGGQEVVVHMSPLRIDVLDKGDLVFTLNSQALLKFEHFRQRTGKAAEKEGAGLQPQQHDLHAEGAHHDVEYGADGKPVVAASDDVVDDQPSPPTEPAQAATHDDEKADQTDAEPADGAGRRDEEMDGWWEEHWKSHYDSKPYGSSSVGLDISFVGFKHVYGLPEHADNFVLKSTTHTEPYRLYNLDVFEYELNNPMALYGAIPYIVGHNAERTVGLLWLNPSETWIDIKSTFADKSLFRSLLDKFKTEPEIPQIDTHWMSETGLIDIYLFFGPSPVDVFRQYTDFVGVMPLPPYFSLAYHQSRWNYNDMDDVQHVDEKFDLHDIPYDTLWLDIEHADGKRYFTWDPIKFSDPKKMIENLESKGRKLVTIIDPHIKRDDNYFIYKEARDLDYFVKDRDNNVYEGWCWPGSSMYLDFLNPVIRDWWGSKFSFDQYNASTPNLHVWNDMNEPSVFNGPEVTMYKDNKHYGGLEHREVHNMYGFYNHMATYKGMLKRTQGQKRPFILTRSFFAGSQRFAAVWTGDNMAEWSHLHISFAMMLSLSVAGMPFVGADVGGFFRNPDEELLVRWYQAGAFNPFFRAHAHLDSRRREPWLLSEQGTNVIREAVTLRYKMLPLWYTVFYEHEITGIPVMRPLWLEFPKDVDTFEEELAAMIGNALLVRPVVEQGATSVSVYLPGENTVWYDFETHVGQLGPGATTVQTPLTKIPIFIRGGTIIPLKMRQRRASQLTKHDPFTLYVALDKAGQFSNGSLFFDDLETFNYKNGQYCYRKLEYIGNEISGTLTSRIISGNTCNTDVWVEKIVIMGLKFKPAKISSDSTPSKLIHFDFDSTKNVAILRKPAFSIGSDWSINLTSS